MKKHLVAIAGSVVIGLVAAAVMGGALGLTPSETFKAASDFILSPSDGGTVVLFAAIVGALSFLLTRPSRAA
jgi:hypothetical protein